MRFFVYIQRSTPDLETRIMYSMREANPAPFYRKGDENIPPARLKRLNRDNLTRRSKKQQTATVAFLYQFHVAGLTNPLTNYHPDIVIGTSAL